MYFGVSVRSFWNMLLSQLLMTSNMEVSSIWQKLFQSTIFKIKYKGGAQREQNKIPYPIQSVDTVVVSAKYLTHTIKITLHREI